MPCYVYRVLCMCCVCTMCIYTVWTSCVYDATDRMKLAGITPNQIVFTSAMEACAEVHNTLTVQTSTCYLLCHLLGLAMHLHNTYITSVWTLHLLHIHVQSSLDTLHIRLNLHHLNVCETVFLFCCAYVTLPMLCMRLIMHEYTCGDNYAPRMYRPSMNSMHNIELNFLPLSTSFLVQSHTY